MATDHKGQTLCTTGGDSVERARAGQTNETGQHESYIVLCPDERAKGFVRPYRDAYKHVGLARVQNPLRDLTDEERERYEAYGYVKYEQYPADPESSVVGRFWTQRDLDRIGAGCGSVTTMGRALSETYARDPSFYGSTFCVHCNAHFPVSEFVWTADGQVLGS